MNPVEIEEALSALAAAPFPGDEFPYAFLEAFGNKPTTIKRLRDGAANPSDIPGGVLQRNNIHMAVSPDGEVSNTLAALRSSPATHTARHRVKFILATDGVMLEAEDLASDIAPIACAYTDFANHFGFFLPLAGLSTVRQIRESTFDIKATGRLNRLYVELLKHNPDWGTAARSHDMNHFMARLIFCFFAEDTHIFNGDNLFTNTVNDMSTADNSNTHEVIAEIFRAMNTAPEARATANLPNWASRFPYVNGGLFSGNAAVPCFSKIAGAYLLQIGRLDWQKINPDIFGSMIQAVADDAERGALGMHYTSVPNILKVLNPLFLDDLRARLAAAGDNPRTLLNLRKRMATIRVFDPACGSGNFLVIAYKEMRAIEAAINTHRGEPDRRTDIPLTNFRGIELRHFAAEIARLALIIAEYQCDVVYRGQQEALNEFLPLDAMNWITCGNALRLNWLTICPPTGAGVTLASEDLLHTPSDQARVDFQNQGGETYICGNPPYRGSTWQSPEQKDDLKAIFAERTKKWKSLDYVAGWFMKAADYGTHTPCVAAFVATNSICQGQQVPILWPLIFATGHEIAFAHTSFKWANLASHNAGVTVAIVGISAHAGPERKLYALNDGDGETETVLNTVASINAYLVPGRNLIVEKASKPLAGMTEMMYGNKPVDGGHLLMSRDQAEALNLSPEQRPRFVRRIYGSAEFIRGLSRYCLWIQDEDEKEALSHPEMAKRIDGVRKMRRESKKKATNKIANVPHLFGEVHQRGDEQSIIIPRVSSENRAYLPCGLLGPGEIVSDRTFAIFDAPIWHMALIASKLHLVWIATVCVRMRTDYSYSNTLGWNTFPVPKLTEKHKQDLTHAAENILLARESHFPATIADLYKPNAMPQNLQHAHNQNDEIIERIYIGRKFKNNTERLKKLFDMYMTMTGRG